MAPAVPLRPSTAGTSVVAMPPRTDVASRTWNAVFADDPIPPPVAMCDRVEVLRITMFPTWSWGTVETAVVQNSALADSA